VRLLIVELAEKVSVVRPFWIEQSVFHQVLYYDPASSATLWAFGMPRSWEDGHGDVSGPKLCSDKKWSDVETVSLPSPYSSCSCWKRSPPILLGPRVGRLLLEKRPLAILASPEWRPRHSGSAIQTTDSHRCCWCALVGSNRESTGEYVFRLHQYRGCIGSEPVK